MAGFGPHEIRLVLLRRNFLLWGELLHVTVFFIEFLLDSGLSPWCESYLLASSGDWLGVNSLNRTLIDHPLVDLSHAVVEGQQFLFGLFW